LRARLHETAPDLLPGLHLRAATWYDQNASPAEAVHHALAVPDFNLVAEIIERAIPRATTWTSIDVATLQEWFSILPDDVMRLHPRLQLVASRVFYLIGRRRDTEWILKQVEALLEDDPAIPDAGNILGLVLADRASYAAVRGDVRQAIAFAQRALTHLPENEATTRMRVSAILGLAHYRAGDTLQAGQAFLQSIAAAKTVGLEFAAVHLVCNLAQVRIVQGRLDRAIEICQQALDMAVVDGVRTSMAGLVELELGRILYARNDLSAAERHVSQGLALLEKSEMTDSFGLGHALLAQIRQAQGESDRARVAIQRAVQIAQTFDVARISALIGACQARIWLAQDKPDLAVRWARDYEQREQMEYLCEFEDLTLARVFLAQDQPSRALALLDGLLSPAETAGRMGTVIEISSLRALALQALGEGDRAFQALKRALQLAEHEGHTRVFVGEGKPMARLLYESVTRGVAPDYARRLLAAFPVAEPEQTVPSKTLDARSELVEPLSERELEVLQLIAEGLTNQEIASRLFLSLHTVKVHAHNIYGKLDVGNRTQAVAKARALGILTLA
jgi:LuxR family maltose regulon positive regulatory protein